MDLGFANTYHRTLKRELAQIEKLDLLIITHIDQDHIGGMLSLINDSEFLKVKDLWFNYSPNEFIFNGNNTQISIKQGISVRDYLITTNCNVNKTPIIVPYFQEFDSVELTVLSPSKELYEKSIKDWKKQEHKTSFPVSVEKTDYHFTFEELNCQEFEKDNSINNGSSLALILRKKNFSILLLGDSFSEVIVDSLKKLGYNADNKLKVDFVKLSHHGSSKNINDDLINFLDCTNFIVLTDGSKKGLPNKKTLVKICLLKVGQQIHFHFNYENEILKSIFTSTELEKFNIQIHFPNKACNFLEIKI